MWILPNPPLKTVPLFTEENGTGGLASSSASKNVTWCEEFASKRGK